MKRLSAFMLVLAALFTFYSCSKEEAPVNNEGAKFKLSVETGAMVVGDETKAGSNNIIVYYFNTGDEISVVNTTTGKYLGNLTCTQTAEPSDTYVTKMLKSKFDGELVGEVSEGDNLAYLYPAMTAEPGSDFVPYEYDHSVQVRNAQKETETIFAAYCNEESTFSTASNKTIAPRSIVFNMATSYLSLHLYNLPAGTKIDKIQISGISKGEEWVINNGVIKANPLDDNQGVLELQCNNGVVANSLGVAYMYLTLPVSSRNEDGRDITVYTEDGQVYTTKFLKSKFTGNTFYGQTLGVSLLQQLKVEVVPETAGLLTENVSIKNTGNVDAYIRATVIANWVDADGKIVATVNGTLTTGDNWIQDGVYYNYTGLVPAGESTTNIVNSYVAGTKPAAADHLSIAVIAQGRETSF